MFTMFLGDEKGFAVRSSTWLMSKDCKIGLVPPLTPQSLEGSILAMVFHPR